MSWDGFLPTLPCAESPFAQNQALPAFDMMSCILSDGVTHPSSLILAHAPDQIPPAVFDLTITTGLCMLSPVPAGRWPFPTLSLQSLRRCLDPLPRSILLVHLLASSQKTTASRQTSHVRHTENAPDNATSTGELFSGLQSFTNVQAPTLDRPQVAPTAVA